jgi:hypothetical protein
MSVPTLRTRLTGGLAALALLAACTDHAPPLDPEAAHPLAAAGGPHVVHVAPPTGDVATDRASIMAALEEVRPGGTVQFAPDTYVIGIDTPGSFAFILVTVPRVTLLGHPDGTTLWGCSLEDILPSNCSGIRLEAEFQSVRDLTFEAMGQPLNIGRISTPTVGGYRIEGNTFRSTFFGVRAFGPWTQPAIIGNNSFENVALGVQVWGRTVHTTDNELAAPDWEQIPFWFAPVEAIVIYSWDEFLTGPCDGNVVARNRIEGFAAGIGVAVVSQAGCRHNVIRDNTIVNSVELDPLPAGPIWLENFTGDPDLLAHTLVQGNHILGSQGLGVYAWVGAQVRFVNNTIRDLTLSQYSPGYLGESNGSGVWVSPGSRNNQILNNRFAAVEAEEVILEGDYNHVATTSASDVVRDLGVGNRITGPGSVVTTAAPAGAPVGAPTTAERAGAPGMLRERFGARGRMLEEGMRVAPH